MESISIRYLKKGEQPMLPRWVKTLPWGWQQVYLEKRKPYRIEGETAILQTTAENSPHFRKQAERLLETLKKQGVKIVIPPMEGELPRGILPFAEGRVLTSLFAFAGAAEALKRQGKNPAECRYLLAGGDEEMWRTALTSMGSEVNHLAIFTADKGKAEKLEQELFAEYGLVAEVFASPKNPAFLRADVVFGCGMEQGGYEYMLKNGAVWIDLAGNRPVLRKLSEKRQDVVVLDGFFFRKGKKQLEGRIVEGEAFCFCGALQQDHSRFLSEMQRKEILCELQERGYALSGFSWMGKRVKIRRNLEFTRKNIDKE